ncbi:MAG TPA: DUF3443 domain-containing protein [Steroidobacteraceae bacterium]
MLRIIAIACLGAFCLAACGGGGSDLNTNGPGGVVTTPAANVQSVTVDGGPPQLANPTANTLYTSVTICVHGTTNCQTIDHIQVDTGSSGFRILASALTLTLPQQTDGNNNPIVECTQFIDGYSWGPLRTADVQVSGESAANIAVQVIGDATYTTVPSDCASTGTAEDTLDSFGANGILGVGPFISDCGAACTTSPNTVYFTCPTATTCADAAVAEAQQVSNPVAFFATDNNGVILQLPSISASGDATVSGALVFGIGTQSNNGLGTAKVYAVDPGNGSMVTTYNGAALTDSFIDSGSNAYYFPDSSIPTCPSNSPAPGFFCPTSTLSLSATLQGATVNGVVGASSTVEFAIANAMNLFDVSTAIAAVDDLGAPSSTSNGFDGANSFDWGLTFYFGRTVYTAIEQRNTSAGMGPYFAF